MLRKTLVICMMAGIMASPARATTEAPGPMQSLKNRLSRSSRSSQTPDTGMAPTRKSKRKGYGPSPATYLISRPSPGAH